MDTDYKPISWNKPLMRVKARIYSEKIDHTNTFVTLMKHTGNTIKRTFTSFNPDTGKTCYGSHSNKCFGCKIPMKSIQKLQTNFKRHMVGGEIRDNNSHEY